MGGIEYIDENFITSWRKRKGMDPLGDIFSSDFAGLGSHVGFSGTEATDALQKSWNESVDNSDPSLSVEDRRSIAMAYFKQELGVTSSPRARNHSHSRETRIKCVPIEEHNENSAASDDFISLRFVVVRCVCRLQIGAVCNALRCIRAFPGERLLVALISRHV